MPSWLKKRLRVLKQDVLNNLIVHKVVKNQPMPLPSNCNNEIITSSEKTPIRKIRNDLKSYRNHGKSDMNAYRDYAKWRDQVLTSQNNCALRCVREEKLINCDVSPTTNDDIIETECRRNGCDNKPVSTNDVINIENCDSESELGFL